MKKSKLSSYFLIVSIFTFLAIFFYLVQNSYSNLMRSTQDAVQSGIMKPIDPTLDLSTLDQIDKRPFYSSDGAVPISP